MYCVCVRDGEGVSLRELSRLSYTCRCISLPEDSVRMGFVVITNGPVSMCDRVTYGRECVASESYLKLLFIITEKMKDVKTPMGICIRKD